MAFLRESVRKALDCQFNPCVPILIVGETGVGKEVLAREIHRKLHRGKFVAINCAGIPESLFEAEFFGYRKGAFTGALVEKRGLIEEANGGTLFLDEVVDMPLPMQSKLLRVLQDGRFRRLGENTERRAEFLLIAATNADLRRKVENGKFRKDLYFRLKGFRIELPPLRLTRHEIIPLLESILEDMGKSPFITSEAAQLLIIYDWPGNVRELRQFAAILPQNGRVEPKDLPFDFFEGEGLGMIWREIQESSRLTLKRRMELLLKKEIIDLLKNGTTIKELSEELEKSVVQTRRILKKLGIPPELYLKRKK